MNQDFTVKKKQYLSEKKFVERDYSHEKKIPAQAVSEKKISCKLKIPHPPPHHFSNGPFLRPHYSERPKRFGSRGPSENVRLGYVTEIN